MNAIYVSPRWRQQCDRPKDSVAALTNAIDATINSGRGDSPVFRLLPNLSPQDRAQLLPVPADFRDDVDRAKRLKSAGDLRVYATEVLGQTWEAEGLRLIGRSQIDVKAWRGLALPLNGYVVCALMIPRSMSDWERSTSVLET
jgi:hypothetical protein